ncbi:hypothetical protein GCM10022255_004240 [Dactylosporangium darangshiense]|uniref:PASTA domain-containing protein n=1 Tax=Dactylosporangium darangshiense TaxID=579108 RepID=A0ABP8CVB4_9ACTN
MSNSADSSPDQAGAGRPGDDRDDTDATRINPPADDETTRPRPAAPEPGDETTRLRPAAPEPGEEPTQPYRPAPERGDETTQPRRAAPEPGEEPTQPYRPAPEPGDETTQPRRPRGGDETQVHPRVRSDATSAYPPAGEETTQPHRAADADATRAHPAGDADVTRAHPAEDADATRRQAPRDATRVQPGEGEGTRVQPPADDGARWSARAGVPQPGDPALRRPAPQEWVEEEDPYQGRSWLRPVFVGMVALVMVAALAFGLFLIYRATVNGQNAPGGVEPSVVTTLPSPPAPTTSPPAATSEAPTSQAPTSSAPPPGQVVIPALRGNTLADATVKLQVLGLNVEVERKADGSLPPGEVLSTRPGEGETVNAGDTVTLIVAAPVSSPAKPGPSASASD